MTEIFDKNSVLEPRGECAAPADSEAGRASAAFCRLFELIRILRAPGGCPWDREQNPLSMRRDLVEEAFEAVDAITDQDSSHAKEELGDVLLNTTMISYMYAQQKKAGGEGFTLDEEINELADKLIRRHPHVFPTSEGATVADKKVETSGQVLNQWDKIKEKVEGRERQSVLDEVPDGFPPLLKAFKYQKKASKKGFDWNSMEPVRAKVLEELAEVDEAAAENNPLHLEEEVGDLFFALVNYARKLGVDPELAVNVANKKFYRRFSYVERKCGEQGIEMRRENLGAMDSFWNECKKTEKNR